MLVLIDKETLVDKIRAIGDPLNAGKMWELILKAPEVKRGRTAFVGASSEEITQVIIEWLFCGAEPLPDSLFKFLEDVSKGHSARVRVIAADFKIEVISLMGNTEISWNIDTRKFQEIISKVYSK